MVSCRFLSIIFAFTFAIFSTASLQAEEKPEKLPKLDLSFLGSTPKLDASPILLEFWATWCPPCRDNIPHLNKLHENHSPHGLVIIGVTDEDRSLVRKFAREHKIAYTIAIDSKDRLSKHFNVKGIPFAVLADKTGTIIWKGHPARLTDEIIAQAL